MAEVRSGALAAAISQAAETGFVRGSSTAVNEHGVEPMRADDVRREGEEGRCPRVGVYETVAVMMRTLLRTGWNRSGVINRRK